MTCVEHEQESHAPKAYVYADFTTEVSRTSSGDSGDSFTLQVCAHHKQEDFVVLVVLSGSTTGTIDMDDRCSPAQFIPMVVILLKHHEVFPH